MPQSQQPEPLERQQGDRVNSAARGEAGTEIRTEIGPEEVLVGGVPGPFDSDLEAAAGGRSRSGKSVQLSQTAAVGPRLDPPDESPPDLAEVMRPLLDAIPDGVVVVDETGQIHLVNHQMQLLFGYNAEDLTNQPVELLLPERFRAVHPIHRAHYHANPHVRPMGIGLQLFGQRRNGTEFPVEISLSPISVSGTPFVLATIRDVTEQRRLERIAFEELEGRLALLQVILDELPAGAYLVRGDNARLVLANRRVAEIWGAEWPEGQPMAAFLAASGARVYHPNGRELAVEQLATMRALRTGQSVRQMHEVLRRADGSTLPVQVDAVALDPQVFPYLSEVRAHPSDPIPVALVMHQDVSALSEAERLKEEFIALAAHELRNPIAALAGYAQMLVTTPVPGRPRPGSRRAAQGRGRGPVAHPEQRRRSGEQHMPPGWEELQEEAVTAVMEAARRLTALTDDLLDATRLHANRMALRPEPIELGALVRRVVRRLQVVTTSARHPLSVRVPDEPVVVMADAQHVEQVLTNLLSNAIKYSPQGGAVEISLTMVTTGGPEEMAGKTRSRGQGRGEAVAHKGEGCDTTAGADAIEIATAATMGRVARVTVSDYGMGIPAEQQAHIFGRFARAQNARQAAIPDTGLGLYLCRELLERQGGRIWFESVEGAGSTFTFELPLLADLPDEGADDAQNDAQDAGQG